MRRQSLLVCLCLMLIWVVLPTLAAAQERQGFWGALGGGFGSADVTCEDCDGDREGSGVGYFKLGWTLNDQLLVGGEFNIWAKTFALEPDVDVTANLYNFSGTVTYYPNASSGLFVRAGAGASVADLDFDAVGTNVTVEIGAGFGLLSGAAYDLRVGQRISVTPAVIFGTATLGT